MRSVLSVKLSPGQRTLLRWHAARCSLEESGQVREAALDAALRGLCSALYAWRGGGLLARELEERVAASIPAMEWLAAPGRLERVLEACAELTLPDPRPEG